jgi:hypothetical protein
MDRLVKAKSQTPKDKNHRNPKSKILIIASCELVLRRAGRFGIRLWQARPPGK